MTWSIHTVVLDLDDTLFAEADFVLSGFRAAGDWLKSERGISGFAEASTGLFERGLRGNIFDEALRALGIVADPELVQQLVRAYRKHAPTLSLLPDVQRFLAARPPAKLALLSDGYLGVQQRKFQALDIASFFSCVVFTDAFGRASWKPSPAGFQRIMEQLGGPPGGYVYVADNPRKDFIAPRALGWKSVRIRRPGGEHASYKPSPAEAADSEIACFDELPSLFNYVARQPEPSR